MRTVSTSFIRTFLIGTASICCLSLMAQEQEPSRGYIGVSLGPSIPIGQFANKSLGNTFSGFASTGAVFDISFAYTFKNNWGMSFQARGQANNLDTQAWANAAAASVANTGWTVTSDPWIASGYMLGGYRSNQLSERLHLDFRAMVGLMLARLPVFNATARSGVDRFEVARTEATASTLATLIGLGLKLDTGRKGCLLLNIDYWGGRVKFENFNVNTSEFTGGFLTSRTSSTGRIEMNMNAINLSIGYGIRL